MGGVLPKKATFLATIVIGIIVLLPFTSWKGIHSAFELSKITLMEWVGILYLGIFPSVLSFLCWNEGIMQVGPSKSSNFLHLIVFFAGIIAFFVGETYSVVQFIGGVMILMGVLVTSNPQFFKLAEL